MTPPSKPPIEQIEAYAQGLVAERGPLELLMAFFVHSDPELDEYFGKPTWELALAATWADDAPRHRFLRADSLLPGWTDTGFEITVLASDGPMVNDLQFFMEGQTRRHPELVDITVGGFCFRRAYVIAHRKAGIGGKLIGADPVAAD